MNSLGPISRWVTLILLVFGLPFICVGLYEAAETQGAVRRGSAAQGTVVDNRYQTVTGGTNVSGAYHPIVEFITAEGRRVRFTDGIGTLPPDYAIGAPVRVLYDPADFQAARLWFAPTLFLVIGALPVTVFAAWQFVTLAAARLRRGTGTAAASVR